jgi:subfamily B ATP-binding cassette protein MsbA
MKLPGFKAAKLIRPLLGRHAWTFLAVILLGTLAALAEGLGMSLVVPFFQELAGSSQGSASRYVRFLDRLLAALPPDRRVMLIPAIIFAIVIVKNALSYATDCLFAWLKGRVGDDLRSAVFNQLVRVDYGFIEGSESGKLLNTLSHETWRAAEALGMFVTLLIHWATVIVFVALLLLISWPFTLIAAAAVVVVSASVQPLSRRLDGLGKHLVRSNASLAQRMVDGISGARVIRAFGRERYEEGRFDAASEKVRQAIFRLEMLAHLVKPLSEIGYAAMFLAVSAFAFRNRAWLPTLLAFVFFLYRLLPHLKHLSASRTMLAGMLSSIEDVRALLDRADKPYTSTGVVPFCGLASDITFDSVTFAYQPAEGAVLRDVSLRIPRGSITAIVGPSGAGKSTLVNLLFRFYDASSGQIRVDGVPLRELVLASWRERIAFAGQDSYLFTGTVRENIAYGRLEAGLEEIMEAAEMANADGFIRELPQGYDTWIGDCGVRLSSGQRQRIVLARALLRKPEILVLDEATNALDSVSEQRIRLALAELGDACTIVVVAHRLSSVDHADQIIVLEKGRVTEQGTYEELLGQNRTFAKLSRLQRQRTAAGVG